MTGLWPPICWLGALTRRRPTWFEAAISRTSLLATGLHPAAVIDLFSRQVVGWRMPRQTRSCLVRNALRMPRFRRHPKPTLVFQSDRGSRPLLQRHMPERAQQLRGALVDAP
jgi:transposase InsO family protein